MSASVPEHNEIDLHTHSTASDGIYAPAELVRLAREAGLRRIALVDHDTTDGVDEAQAAGDQLGVTVIACIELNTELPERRAVEAPFRGAHQNVPQLLGEAAGAERGPQPLRPAATAVLGFAL